MHTKFQDLFLGKKVRPIRQGIWLWLVLMSFAWPLCEPLKLPSDQLLALEVCFFWLLRWPKEFVCCMDDFFVIPRVGVHVSFLFLLTSLPRPMVPRGVRVPLWLQIEMTCFFVHSEPLGSTCCGWSSILEFLVFSFWVTIWFCCPIMHMGLQLTRIAIWPTFRHEVWSYVFLGVQEEACNPACFESWYLVISEHFLSLLPLK